MTSSVYKKSYKKSIERVLKQHKPCRTFRCRRSSQKTARQPDKCISCGYITNRNNYITCDKCEDPVEYLCLTCLDEVYCGIYICSSCERNVKIDEVIS